MRGDELGMFGDSEHPDEEKMKYGDVYNIAAQGYIDECNRVARLRAYVVRSLLILTHLQRIGRLEAMPGVLEDLRLTLSKEGIRHV